MVRLEHFKIQLQIPGQAVPVKFGHLVEVDDDASAEVMGRLVQNVYRAIDRTMAANPGSALVGAPQWISGGVNRPLPPRVAEAQNDNDEPMPAAA